MGAELTLKATSTLYYSAGDEYAFFDWLSRIECVGEPWGRGEELFIPLVRAPTDDDLREIIALFFRYKVDMRQLAQFRSESNAKWFGNRRSFWHRRVFG